MRIKGQSDIEIIISEDGYIRLKQQSTADGEQLIEFAPAYGAKIADAIGSLKEFAQAKFDKAELVEE